jgi:hypothetical protein
MDRGGLGQGQLPSGQWSVVRGSPFPSAASEGWMDGARGQYLLVVSVPGPPKSRFSYGRSRSRWTWRGDVAVKASTNHARTRYKYKYSPSPAPQLRAPS